MDQDNDHAKSRRRALIPITGTALAMVILAIVAIIGAGTVMMMMG